MQMLLVLAVFLWLLALAVAFIGACGLFSLLVLDEEHWAVRLGAWVLSLIATAALVVVPYNHQWGPFAPGDGCTRSHPCVQMPVMPTPTITMKADLPGTPTGEECRAELTRRKAAGEFPAPSVVVGECS